MPQEATTKKHDVFSVVFTCLLAASLQLTIKWHKEQKQAFQNTWCKQKVALCRLYTLRKLADFKTCICRHVKVKWRCAIVSYWDVMLLLSGERHLIIDSNVQFQALWIGWHMTIIGWYLFCSPYDKWAWCNSIEIVQFLCLSGSMADKQMQINSMCTRRFPLLESKLIFCTAQSKY